ncbi:MAG TPA: DedA family protein, partial [Polyangiaceae bacterium]|nr:DedA family protein [Polyangiaceae bacterium]
GTFFEGETVLLMAGYAAHAGRLSFGWVVVAAFFGSLVGDQTAFWFGHHYGTRLLSRFPRLRPQVERASALLRRVQAPLLLGFRFVYGIRVATPIAAALAKVPLVRFVVLNALGAAVWAVVITGAGYLFGHGISRVFEHAKHFEHIVLGVIAALGVALTLVHWLRRRTVTE